MNLKVEYFLLALIGLTMMLLGGYTQWVSTDLNQYPLAEYVTQDVRSWSWWTTVGIPVLAGCAYISASFIGAKSKLAGNAAIGFFLAAFFLDSFSLLWVASGYLPQSHLRLF